MTTHVNTRQENLPVVSNLAGIIHRVVSSKKNLMPVEIDQLIRTKRKTIALIVRPDGSLVVRAPLRASERSIQEFVSNNIQWIEKNACQDQGRRATAAETICAG